MELIVSLVGVPCLAALLMLIARADRARDAITVISAVCIGVLSIAFAAVYLKEGATYIALPDSCANPLGLACFFVEIAIGACILAYAIRYKRILAASLAIVQIVIAVWLETSLLDGHAFSTQIRIDELTVIMVLIIGIVGSGICVYALGYMKDFQRHHADCKDRRPVFFALMFVFLGAMFTIVFSDNMLLIYAAWEVTTLCSFLLIGFTKTGEAIDNAFRQIVMNMLGGIAFQAAIVLAAVNGLPLVFSEFLMEGALSAGTAAAGLFAVPIVLLAFAGMTKAAQMPFHTWLLGAMVAPTPTSALLHSSTMVKAGVFLLIKLSPLFLVFPIASGVVVLVGGLTFLFSSFLAISQSNAKRVLAYSTIANLGLITACAGVGTPEAIWAAIFLVIFHAVAKSLLFLCVGTAEHRIGSRDIEDMDELFERMPRLARFMMLGIMVMFIAPFGMLVSKWAALSSFAATGHVVLLVLLAFGSAATFMFWGKWLGKLAGIAAHRPSEEVAVSKAEWTAIALMAALAVACCIGMPFISSSSVEPYLVGVYGMAAPVIGFDNMAIMGIVSAFIVAVIFGTLGKAKKNIVPVYMAGITVDSSKRTFKGSFGQAREATSRNWYLEGIFGEKRLDKPATAITAAVLVVGIVASVFMGASVDAASLPLYIQAVSLHESAFATLAGIVVFLVIGPVLGCLLAGVDRIVSARMQGRVGPPLLQPYYDVRKLIAKDDASVNTVEGTYVTMALVFTLIAGGVFFGGGNFLMCVFLVTLSALFFVLAAYSSRSIYAEIGADREILQVMSYEPMILFVAIGMMLAVGTFDVAGLFQSELPMIVAAWPIFIGLLFVLTIKLRKSPFDLSYSHHAHQELVKGVTTEMSGRTLAKVEIMHWCENVLFMAWIAMFFICSEPVSVVLGAIAAVLVYLFEIWIDNNFARVKWQACLKWAWIISLVAGFVNILGLVLYIVFM